MAHSSEKSSRLSVKEVTISDEAAVLQHVRNFSDVCVLRLPSNTAGEYNNRLQGVGDFVTSAATALSSEATLVTLGEVTDLVAVQAAMPASLRYQSWIAIKCQHPQVVNEAASLPHHHFGALIHTRYDASLRHAKTRIAYTYCPACDKTTKDYGGKKHTYHEYGTLMSDVWRDIACDLEGDLAAVIERFADFFGIEPYKELRVIDCRAMPSKRVVINQTNHAPQSSGEHQLSKIWVNNVVEGDCLQQLRKLPDNSIDFAFADPPYNLSKNYTGYADDLEPTEYFRWCDEWITELARVLKPGRTCAILNIPLYAIRHFTHLETVLNFQNWIAWDALSFPVRMLMPAHYAILCFSKGIPRSLPGLTNTRQTTGLSEGRASEFLNPLDESYCLRAFCTESRANDRGTLTDLWWDIHRLKHNTRRVDHPCQLSPHLMYRLISLFTTPGESVLDCFNGAGTTTLAAHQLKRIYIGIEKEKAYRDLALSRHVEIDSGLDPFRKADRVLTAKNSPVRRLPKQKYEIPKKTLQLEVRRVAKELGKLPNRDELIHYSKYPIKYYDEYFVSWGEVCAAARTTGMTEDRVPTEVKQLNFQGIK